MLGKPPPIGVVTGPFSPTCVRSMESISSFGMYSLYFSKASAPAANVSHSNLTPVASRMRTTASVTSGPMPSPGMSVTLCVIRFRAEAAPSPVGRNEGPQKCTPCGRCRPYGTLSICLPTPGLRPGLSSIAASRLMLFLFRRPVPLRGSSLSRISDRFYKLGLYPNRLAGRRSSENLANFELKQFMLETNNWKGMPPAPSKDRLSLEFAILQAHLSRDHADLVPDLHFCAVLPFGSGTSLVFSRSFNSAMNSCTSLKSR